MVGRTEAIVIDRYKRVLVLGIIGAALGAIGFVGMIVCMWQRAHGR